MIFDILMDFIVLTSDINNLSVNTVDGLLGEACAHTVHAIISHLAVKSGGGVSNGARVRVLILILFKI